MSFEFETFDGIHQKFQYQYPTVSRPLCAFEKSPRHFINVYQREGGTDKSGISIVEGPDDVLNIDMSSGKSMPSIKRIEGDYVGVKCREKVIKQSLNPEDYDNVLSGMEDFCKKNPDMKVCKEFCSNDTYTNYCVTRSQLLMYVFLGGSLVAIIVMILLIRKKRKVPIIISAVAAGGLLGLFVWRLIVYVTNPSGYNGNKPDFPADAVPPAKQSCATMWYNCVDPSQPYGSRCAPASKGVGVFGKDACESGGCCMPGFQTYNGKCYESPPKGNVIVKGLQGGFRTLSICPYPYRGTMSGPMAAPCSFVSHAREGDMYCSGKDWVECSGTPCIPPSIPAVNGKPLAFCDWPPTS